MRRYEVDFTDNKSWEEMKEEMLKENGPDIGYMTLIDMDSSVRRTIYNWFNSTKPKRLYHYESLADLHKRFHSRKDPILWEIINQFHQIYRIIYEQLEQSHQREIPNGGGQIMRNPKGSTVRTFWQLGSGID